MIGVLLAVCMPVLTDLFGTHVSQFFSGHLADGPIWARIGGVVLAGLGVWIMVNACGGKEARPTNAGRLNAYMLRPFVLADASAWFGCHATRLFGVPHSGHLIDSSGKPVSR